MVAQEPGSSAAMRRRGVGEGKGSVAGVLFGVCAGSVRLRRWVIGCCASRARCVRVCGISGGAVSSAATYRTVVARGLAAYFSRMCSGWVRFVCGDLPDGRCEGAAGVLFCVCSGCARFVCGDAPKGCCEGEGSVSGVHFCVCSGWARFVCGNAPKGCWRGGGHWRRKILILFERGQSPAATRSLRQRGCVLPARLCSGGAVRPAAPPNGRCCSVRIGRRPFISLLSCPFVFCGRRNARNRCTKCAAGPARVLLFCIFVF